MNYSLGSMVYVQTSSEEFSGIPSVGTFIGPIVSGRSTTDVHTYFSERKDSAYVRTLRIHQNIGEASYWTYFRSSCLRRTA